MTGPPGVIGAVPTISIVPASTSTNGGLSVGFGGYATTSGITIAINDIQVSAKKPAVLKAATELVKSFEEQYLSGLISEDERYRKTVDAWTAASDETTALVEEELPNYGGIAVMAVSGAKGNMRDTS